MRSANHCTWVLLSFCWPLTFHAYYRAGSGTVGWEEQEEKHLETFVTTYNTNPLTSEEYILSDTDKKNIKEIMKSRCLVSKNKDTIYYKL